MRKHSLIKTILIGLISGLSILVVSGTLFAAEPEDLIKYRKNVMKVIGGHTGAVFAIAGGKVDHADAFVAHATGLNAAAQMTKTLFPEDSAVGETGAKQDIWDKPDEFQEAVQKFEMAAAALLEAAQANDKAATGAALKQLGGSCKGCHDNFRQKK